MKTSHRKPTHVKNIPDERLFRGAGAKQKSGMVRSLSQKLVRVSLWIFSLGLAGALVLVLIMGLLLVASLPTLDGEIQVAGLASPVSVETDARGIPSIAAQSRIDSYRALGFVHANDRLFQMDLLRRRSAGRLAELFGASVVAEDKWHKVMGFEHVAEAVFTRLPEDQREILAAYAEGVNAALTRRRIPPWEFLTLGYLPEPWRPEDSLLVILGLYERLSWSGPDEQAATVIERAFSKRVSEFFFPARDCYTESVLGTEIDKCRLEDVPVEDFHAALSDAAARAPLMQHPPARLGKGGSNAWVVAPGKSGQDRAMLANDMHLDLLVPNIWYRTDFHYGKTELTGLTLPGMPLVISGSNRHIAWGFTNVAGDFSDLILLDEVGDDGDTYLTPEGPKHFGERTETIRVRGEAPVSVVVKETIWGPVLPEKLLQKQVAVRWTALDPNATDIALSDLESAASVDEALTLLNHSGGPALNGLVADDSGNIGWTYTGKIPIRVGYDGLMARSWSDGTKRWQGYIRPDALPRIVNPPSGFIVSANQRMVGEGYPLTIAHGFDGGYRAYHITQALTGMRNITERDMLALQLETGTEFYRYYQRLALSSLTLKGGRDEDAFRRALRHHLAAWEGKAEPGSLGLALIVELQNSISEALFVPLLEHCRAVDPRFNWNYYRETSLRQILEAKPTELLPKNQNHADWDDFIITVTENAARRLMERRGVDRLEDLTWDKVSVVPIRHPLSPALPGAERWIDMPLASLPGCEECVRWSSQDGGATERLVVSPGHEQDGIFEMPAGQSGHPLSAFYRDQHKDWVAGVAAPLLAGPAKHRLELKPAHPSQTHDR
ncbi:penicillin acylase family protein [Beijerinckiaceae bacterium]|nr:penicillin acylase family protein [Beijerinckiaceae bacterium]